MEPLPGGLAVGCAIWTEGGACFVVRREPQSLKEGAQIMRVTVEVPVKQGKDLIPFKVIHLAKLKAEIRSCPSRAGRLN